MRRSRRPASTAQGAGQWATVVRGGSAVSRGGRLARPPIAGRGRRVRQGASASSRLCVDPCSVPYLTGVRNGSRATIVQLSAREWSRTGQKRPCAAPFAPEIATNMRWSASPYLTFVRAARVQTSTPRTWSGSVSRPSIRSARACGRHGSGTQPVLLRRRQGPPPWTVVGSQRAASVDHPRLDQFDRLDDDDAAQDVDHGKALGRVDSGLDPRHAVPPTVGALQR